MGLPVSVCRVRWLFLWLCLAAGCADDTPFQSLSSLCVDLAEDICNARVNGCCASTDPLACNANEKARCETQFAALQAEVSYDFDAVEAAHTRKVSRAQLDLCGSPPTLVSFFEGGLAVGAPCERDSQCGGGLCTLDTRVCAIATPSALCPAQ